jgi:hypothetical protein
MGAILSTAPTVASFAPPGRHAADSVGSFARFPDRSTDPVKL